MPQLYRVARRLIDVRREQQLRWLWSQFVPVRHRSRAENVYHCCVWKTASQWIRNVFSATDIYRASGLLPYAYEQFEGCDDRALQVRRFAQPFPLRRIISPLYINSENFERMPKPAEYRAFFITRDPRDLVISHYFSSRYSHLKMPSVVAERARFEGMSDEEGMLLHIEYMAQLGVFEALRSWAMQRSNDEKVEIFRFEDLVGPDQLEWMMQVMRHCDIEVPKSSLESILQRLSFVKLSGGRQPGDENTSHKYRSGKHGDWKKYFDNKITQSYHDAAGDLAETLGYSGS